MFFVFRKESWFVHIVFGACSNKERYMANDEDGVFIVASSGHQVHKGCIYICWLSDKGHILNEH